MEDECIIALCGQEYSGSSNWIDNDSGTSCTFGSNTVFNSSVKAFHFDYSQASLITCPYNISPSAHSDITIEVIFKLDDNFDLTSTQLDYWS